MAYANERGQKEEPSNPLSFSFTGGLSGYTKPEPSNPVNVASPVAGVSNPNKGEEEEEENNSGGGNEGGGGGGVATVNPNAGGATQTDTVINEGGNTVGGDNGGGSSDINEQANALKEAQEAAARKQAEEQARQAEARRQAEEQARQQAIQAQQAATLAMNQAAEAEVSQPAETVPDAIAQADANVSAIEEQLNIARANGSTDDILRLTEDLLEAQRTRQYLESQARAIAGVGTTSTANPLAVAPQVVNNEYAQPTVGVNNPLANNFANTLLRPNDSRSSAFVKNAGRAVQEDEDEFWLGGDRPGITRDQFLEATSSLLNPLMNIGVRPAEAAYPYHPNVVPPTGTPDVTPGHTLGAGPAEPGTMNFATHMGPELRRDPGTSTPGTWQSNLGWGNREPSLTNNDVMAPYADAFSTVEPSALDNILAGVYNASNSDGWATSKASDAYGETPRIDPETPGYELLEEQRRNNILQGMLDIDAGLDVSHPELTGEDVMNIRQDVKNNYPPAVTNAFRAAKALANPTQDVLKVLGPLGGAALRSFANQDNTPYNDTVQTAQEAAVNAGLFPGTTAYDNFVDNYVAENQPASTNQPRSNVPENFTPATPGATPRPNDNPFASLQSFNVTDNPESYVDNTMRDIMGNRTFAGLPTFNVDDPFATISPEDNWQLRGIYNALPEFWTEGEKGQFLYDAINNPDKGTVKAPDPGVIASMAPPSIDENGVPNYTLALLGRKDEEGHPIYDADTVFQAFADTSGEAMKDGGQVAWKQPVQDMLNDPTLTPEERAGLNAILTNNWWAGDSKVGRDLYPRQYFDGTRAQYDRLADLLTKKLGLDYLIDQGVINDSDVTNFFLKAPAGAEGNPLAGDSGSGKPQTLPASYGQGDKVVKAPYRKGGYTEAELQAMGNSPYKDYRGYDAYEGYYYNYNDGKWYPVDQEKANYYNENHHSYRGWDEGMRDYYNTFGTFKGYTPTWQSTGKSSGGGSRSYSYRGGNSYNYGGSNSNRSYTRNVNTPSLTANTQRYNSGGSSYTPQYATQQRSIVNPNTASQRSNRVYNIMKNWSF